MLESCHGNIFTTKKSYLCYPLVTLSRVQKLRLLGILFLGTVSKKEVQKDQYEISVTRCRLRMLSVNQLWAECN